MSVSCGSSHLEAAQVSAVNNRAGEEEKQVSPPLEMSCISILSARVCLITVFSPRFIAAAVALGWPVMERILVAPARRGW